MVDCPVTVARPLELAALTVTWTAARGVASPFTTTKTTVPEGVAAAAVATTVGPVSAGVAVGDGVLVAVVAELLARAVPPPGVPDVPVPHPTSAASGSTRTAPTPRASRATQLTTVAMLSM
jgi:hypothetical protein